MFVDLEKVFKANFVSLHGSSIKKVAPHFGFAWRVDDPGGAISQTYLSKVHTSTDPDEVAKAKGVAADLQRGRQRGHGQDPRRHEVLGARDDTTLLSMAIEPTGCSANCRIYAVRFRSNSGPRVLSVRLRTVTATP